MALVGAPGSPPRPAPAAQTDALTAAGCAEAFTDRASGTLVNRPALEQALDYLPPGDTPVITKLDRCGRSARAARPNRQPTRLTHCPPAGAGRDALVAAAGQELTSHSSR